MFAGKHFVQRIDDNCLTANNLSIMCKQCVNTRPTQILRGQHIKIGQIGEKIAADYLKQHQYKILRTNISYPWGEIDIIAKDPDKILVFVEVKTLDKRGIVMHNNTQTPREYIFRTVTRPEDNLSRPKLLKLRKACLFFANKYPRLSDHGWRIDLLALTLLDKHCDMKHLKNIS